MDYWNECISEALEDAGVEATDKQIDVVAGWVEGAHENYGLATGNDVANANFISDEARELKSLKAEIERQRIWECESKPCTACVTTGVTLDGWGREWPCSNCRGEGRVIF